MYEKLEDLVKERLSERGFELNYDPKKGTYTPWYKIPFKVEFKDNKGIGVGRVNLFRRKIIIPKKGEYKTIDDFCGVLLHEAGHVDQFPVDLPLMGFLFYKIASQNPDKSPSPIDDILSGIVIGLGYVMAREFAVEGYNLFKYGFKKYSKLLQETLFKLPQ